MKIDENSKYRQKKSSYLLKGLRNFNEVFKKDLTYDDIESNKRQGFTLTLGDTFSEKQQGCSLGKVYSRQVSSLNYIKDSSFEFFFLEE